MSDESTVSLHYRLVAVLFELLEGRRDVRSAIRELQQVLRGVDRELDGFLRRLEAGTAADWAHALRAAAEAEESSRDESSRDESSRDESSRDESSRGGGLATVVPLSAAGGKAADYSAAFEVVSARAATDAERIAAERTRVARELRRLLALRADRRAAAIRDSRRAATRSPLLVEGLLEEACRVRGASPRLALELTEAAVLAARRVHPRHGRGRRWRLEQRAAAHHANVLRILGELPAAETAWRRIGERLAAEPVDLPDEEAELLSLEASLRIDLRQFETAERLLRRAERLYRRVGEDAGAARVLLSRGSVAFYAGDPTRAADCERRAGELLDPEAEPVLFNASQRNLADILVDLGRPAEAAALLNACAARFERHDDPADRLRRTWIEARIARAEGRRDGAERRLLEVRNGWLSLQRPFDAALATLDLAELGLERGDWRRVQRRAALLAPVFEARGVHREAKAALALCRQAAQAERLSAEFLARLRWYLRFARRDRRLRFDPEAGPTAG